jgi:hypothetical protein
MSAQGATIGRRGIGVHLPMWPVAILVAAVAAATIGMTVLTEEGQPKPVTSVTDIERIANSSAAVREQGAALPIVVGISHVAPSVTGFAGFENPSAYATAWDSIGGPNEALHRQYSPPQEGVARTAGSDPIIVNGEPCMQCR